MDADSQRAELEQALAEHSYGIQSYEVHGAGGPGVVATVTLLEGARITVGVSASGFYVVQSSSTGSKACGTRHYETLTMLLHDKSPRFSERFRDALDARLQQLLEEQQQQ
ncbi:hypothetical protein EV182_006754 [Spiromyces aspiralis]|uniref:Uncharacterized protein n=1 Tax=Spiromyces aspiralis TaxID=68401 RepID=A0ACC1HBL0_9FUNG|nr:hypothetical protein EV182_006754 [Spiromyces aspiralis]